MSDASKTGDSMAGNETVSDDAATRLEAFAVQLAGEPGDSPPEVARRRGWLDEKGNPTQEGRELLKALDDQRDTRSALRNLP